MNSLQARFLCAKHLVGSSSSVIAMSWSQSVLEASGDAITAKPSRASLVTLGPTTPHLLRVREEIVEGPSRRRPRRVLRCAPTLIDSDTSGCEGSLPPARSDGFQPAAASSQEEVLRLPTSGGFQPVTASSQEDSLLVLLETTMDEQRERRVELQQRREAIDLCLGRITREAPHDDDLGDGTLVDEAEARAHTRELRAAGDADAAARASRALRAMDLAAARDSLFQEEARLLVGEPCICAQALELFEGDFERDCAVALATARRIIGTLPTCERFYIGLCASPIQRWHSAGHGHVHTWARMCLCHQ
jgi:hypothetical protein